MIHARTLHALEFSKITEYLAELCLTAAARSLAAGIAPFANADQAVEALEFFEQYKIWAGAPGTGGKFSLSDFPDVSPMLGKVGKYAQETVPSRKPLPDCEEFWGLREMLRLAQKAHDSIICESAPRQWPLLLQLAQAAPLPEQLLAALNRCISDDGQFKDESSPELFRLRNEMRSLHQNCLRKVREFAQKYNILAYLQDDFMTLSSDRYVLPLKANFKGRIQGVIHDWSHTGETCYFEPIFLVEINNRLRELKREEREEEGRILLYLYGLLEAELAGAQGALDLLATLDLLRAKCGLSETLGCNSASFTPEGEGIELLGARHPLLVLAASRHKGQPAMPLDIILRPGEKALVITGGNAGGKTVCLKTLGLIAAMLMSGIPAPVQKGSHLPWFDRMDAFIGDEQSLDAHVSTFTAQIDHLGKAWKHLDDRGLVLLDEFGAGTDPAEGAALAQAVLDELLEKRCFILSATHFPALKTYALTRKGARAASMLFDPQTNKPLFKLAYDQVGASQALLVAAEHGLPDAILARARHYLLQDGQESAHLIDRLNHLAVEREKELENLKKEQARSKSALAEGKEKLERERTSLQRDVREKISELMRAWKEQRATAKQSMKEMSKLRTGLVDNEKPADSVLPQPENFAVGQQVLHNVFSKRGKITDIDERRKKVRLDMNGVSLWADMKDIRQPGGDVAPAPKSQILTPAPRASMTVDVRGKRADEAIAETQAFIDRAILAGFSEVEIVHGRGTGALRREIHEYLRGIPAVSDFVLAPADRGGDGMTIVRLD